MYGFVMVYPIWVDCPICPRPRPGNGQMWYMVLAWAYRDIPVLAWHMHHTLPQVGILDTREYMGTYLPYGTPGNKCLSCITYVTYVMYAYIPTRTRRKGT